MKKRFGAMALVLVMMLSVWGGQALAVNTVTFDGDEITLPGVGDPTIEGGYNVYILDDWYSDDDTWTVNAGNKLKTKPGPNSLSELEGGRLTIGNGTGLPAILEVSSGSDFYQTGGAMVIGGKNLNGDDYPGQVIVNGVFGRSGGTIGIHPVNGSFSGSGYIVTTGTETYSAGLRILCVNPNGGMFVPGDDYGVQFSEFDGPIYIHLLPDAAGITLAGIAELVGVVVDKEDDEYEYSGWSTASDTTGTKITDAWLTSNVSSGTKTIYAQWGESGGGGSGSGDGGGNTGGYTPPITYNQPKLTGTALITGYEGEVGAQQIEATLSNAYFSGSELEVKANILDAGGKAVDGNVVATSTAKVKENGKVVFDFTAEQLNALLDGEYRILASMDSSYRNYAVAGDEIGTATITPITWSIPETVTVVDGQSKNVVSVVPTGHGLPAGITFESSHPAIAAVSAKGVVQGKSVGTATITGTDSKGVVLSCKVNVIQNRFDRTTPLLLKGTKGVFSSTYQLYYENGNLVAKVFLVNRSKTPLTGIKSFTFKLMQGDNTIYSKAAGKRTFSAPLKHNHYKVYTLTITDSMLPGVSDRALDLTTGKIQGTVTGTMVGGKRIQALLPSTDKAIRSKRSEVTQDGPAEDIAPALELTAPIVP